MKISVSRSHILVTVYRKVFHVESGYPRYVSVNTNYTYTTIIEYTPWSYQVGLSLKVQSHFPYLELDVGKWIEFKYDTSFVVSLNIIASSLLLCPCTSDVHPNDNIRINACSFQWRWWQDLQHPCFDGCLSKQQQCVEWGLFSATEPINSINSSHGLFRSYQ